MNTKSSAYSRQELQDFTSHVHDQIRSNGLPQGYASGLPFHEAKRNYIKERINNWVYSKKLAFEHSKRREAQARIEQERSIHQESKSEKTNEQAMIDAEQKRLAEIEKREAIQKLEDEEQKRQAIIDTEQKRLADIKRQEDARKKEVEQKRLADIKRQEDARKKEVEQKRLADIKLQEDARKKEVEQKRLADIKLQEDARKKEVEQSRLDDIKRQEEEFSIQEKKNTQNGFIDEFSFVNPFTSPEALPNQQASYMGSNYQKNTIETPKENPEWKKIFSSISDFNNHNDIQNQSKFIKIPFEIEKSIKYLDNLDVSFNINDNPEHVLLQISSCFKNIPFSLDLKQANIIKLHQLVYQEVISDLSKNFPSNGVFNYYHNSVNSRLESLYKNVGTYLLFLHYINAFIIIKSKSDESLKKENFKYFDELIFQASFLFNRVYELKIKIFKYLSFIDFNKKNINIGDIDEVLECLKDGINQLLDIYSTYILNNHLLFTFNDNENSIQYSIYLSSKAPEINNVFSQQVKEII